MVAGCWRRQPNSPAAKSPTTTTIERVELCLFAGKRPEQLGVRPALVEVTTPTSSATTAARPASAVASVVAPETTIVQPTAPQRQVIEITPVFAPPPPPPWPLKWRIARRLRLGLLGVVLGTLAALGWLASILCRSLRWLARMLWRGVVSLWSWLDEVNGGRTLGWAIVAVIAAAMSYGGWVMAGRPPLRWPSSADSGAAAVSTVAPAPPTVAPTLAPRINCGTLRVRSATVNLRRGPGTSNKPLAQLHKGTLVTHRCTVQVAADGSNWVLVQTQEGTEGWVRGDLMQ